MNQSGRGLVAGLARPWVRHDSTNRSHDSGIANPCPEYKWEPEGPRQGIFIDDGASVTAAWMWAGVATSALWPGSKPAPSRPR